MVDRAAGELNKNVLMWTESLNLMSLSNLFGETKEKMKLREATKRVLKVQTCFTSTKRKWNFFVADHNFLVYFRVRDG